MSDRCKLGDIAIIIKEQPGCEANIGRLVHVLGPRKVYMSRGTVWRIKPVKGNSMAYLDYDNSPAYGLATDIEHEDAWLLPIRPEADDAHIEQSETESLPLELEVH
jgi:hypothetical protein